MCVFDQVWSQDSWIFGELFLAPLWTETKSLELDQSPWLIKLFNEDIAKLFCLDKNQEWLVFFQVLEKKANYDGECSFYIWQSVLTVFCRFLRLLCRHWLNITNFVSLRNAIFYLTRDKSVISQASKSSGRLSEHRTSFILPGGTPSCIIYIIGRAWKKHRAV